MTGYVIGPTLLPEEYPFQNDGVPNWEQDKRIDDGHPHEWESVLLMADGRHRVRMEEVVRCIDCHAPRCGYSTDPDPCMGRRHHREDHRTFTGKQWPVGGTYA